MSEKRRLRLCGSLFKMLEGGDGMFGHVLAILRRCHYTHRSGADFAHARQTSAVPCQLISNSVSFFLPSSKPNYPHVFFNSSIKNWRFWADKTEPWPQFTFSFFVSGVGIIWLAMIPIFIAKNHIETYTLHLFCSGGFASLRLSFHKCLPFEFWDVIMWSI